MGGDSDRLPANEGMRMMDPSSCGRTYQLDFIGDAGDDDFDEDKDEDMVYGTRDASSVSTVDSSWLFDYIALEQQERNRSSESSFTREGRRAADPGP
jgi:hypothetical protein